MGDAMTARSFAALALLCLFAVSPAQAAPADDAAAGFVTFARETNGQTSQVPFRITLTLLRQGKVWKIAAHHVSPKGT
jgi:hypothetical protein